MPSNKGTGKLLFITAGVILLVAIIILVILFVRKNGCPAEVKFEITPGTEILVGDLITVTDKTEKSTRWEWDFGDGSPMVKGRTLQHRFTAPGPYTIILTVNDCKSFSQAILVKAPEVIVPAEPDLMPVIVGPASHTAYYGEKVKFSDNTPGALSWEWFFEGNHILTEKDVTYEFTTTGPKTVQLVVNSAAGKSKTATFELKVLPKPVKKEPIQGGGPRPGPMVKEKTVAPLINEKDFKGMLINFSKGGLAKKDFSKFVGGNMTMPILVNDQHKEFAAFLNDLLLHPNPNISTVVLTADPATGTLLDIVIKMN